MRNLHSVAAIRDAEAAAMAAVGPDALMQRAAFGLAATCMDLLRQRCGRVSGTRVVLFVGSGNNGGDTLFAGARLASRGARVDAIATTDQVHEAGLAALRAAGGRLWRRGSVDNSVSGPLVASADIVLDGIVGIGGRGALSGLAAELAGAAQGSTAVKVAVDVPSGVDADTGQVADPDAAFWADVTVTFGADKPGLLLPGGRDLAGVVERIDIGLRPFLLRRPTLRALSVADVQRYLAAPGPRDHKYSRGVVGLLTGSSTYPGAGILSVAGARRSGVGMVHYLSRSGAGAPQLVEQFPDVVISDEDPSADPRVSAWGVGSGLGLDSDAQRWLRRALAAEVPVVLDADALTLLTEHDALREQLSARTDRGVLTVLTPHLGEFRRLGFVVDAEGPLAAARRAAEQLRCVVVLKGSGTVIAGPSGTAYVDPVAAHELATAGTGDILTGLVAGMLAHAAAIAPQGETTRTVAASVYLHGLAAKIAGSANAPVTAVEVAEAIPEAVASIRSA